MRVVCLSCCPNVAVRLAVRLANVLRCVLAVWGNNLDHLGLGKMLRRSCKSLDLLLLLRRIRNSQRICWVGVLFPYDLL